MAHPHPFVDLLHPGEPLLVELAGPGPSRKTAVGEAQVWHHLGLTPGRLLVVVSVRSALAAEYQPEQRYGLDQRGLRLFVFPRTPTGAARVEVHGAGVALAVFDVDAPERLARLPSFVASFRGKVETSGVVVVRPADPLDAEPPPNTRALFLALGAGLFTLLLCCGCAGLLLGVRSALAP